MIFLCLAVASLCPLAGSAQTRAGNKLKTKSAPPQNKSTLSSENITLMSPDQDLVFIFKQLETGPAYQVVYQGSTLIEDSHLNLVSRDEPDLMANLTQLKPMFREVSETYDLIIG